jgi:hypothetical protein
VDVRANVGGVGEIVEGAEENSGGEDSIRSSSVTAVEW